MHIDGTKTVCSGFEALHLASVQTKLEIKTRNGLRLKRHLMNMGQNPMLLLTTEEPVETFLLKAPEPMAMECPAMCRQVGHLSGCTNA